MTMMDDVDDNLYVFKVLQTKINCDCYHSSYKSYKMLLVAYSFEPETTS